jgi:environmental stress-induced protein Ves
MDATDADTLDAEGTVLTVATAANNLVTFDAISIKGIDNVEGLFVLTLDVAQNVQSWTGDYTDTVEFTAADLPTKAYSLAQKISLLKDTELMVPMAVYPVPVNVEVATDTVAAGVDYLCVCGTTSQVVATAGRNILNTWSDTETRLSLTTSTQTGSFLDSGGLSQVYHVGVMPMQGVGFVGTINNSRYRVISALGRVSQEADTEGTLLGTYACSWSDTRHVTSVGDTNANIVNLVWLYDLRETTKAVILSFDAYTSRQSVGVTQCDLYTMQVQSQLDFIMMTTPLQATTALGVTPSVVIPNLPFVSTSVSAIIS